MEEYQRYGRNKDTIINSAYINSGEYRRKFDKITSNSKINHILYLKAKEMLFHRSGTLYEDMYWIDGITGEVVASILDEDIEEQIEYTKSVIKAIKGKTTLITIHTHPNSMPPSVADFNSCCDNNYLKSLVICHDGTIYEYVSNQEISSQLYEAYVKRFKNFGDTERDAQFKALEKISSSYKIKVMEV